MAPLPKIRIEVPAHPFENVGVDYFGPISVKRGRGTEKRYGCLFTCLQTRAVHLEISFNMTTDSFIMAFTRFVGRRGKPRKLISDNASNFVSASRELRTWVESLNVDHLGRVLCSHGIEWSFNPSYASHRGGVWERLIRSVKDGLNRVTREQTMTDEVLSTLLIEVERILNNRPLVPFLGDNVDKLALRPSDILLMRNNGGILPEASIIDRYNRGWRQAQQLASAFWKRWSDEYLRTLLKRQRWMNKQRNLRVDDVVLVVCDHLPKDQWPLGIIQAVEVSADGLVRTAIVKCKGKSMRRDIRKLCLLEEGAGVPASHSPQVGGGPSGLPTQGGPL